MTSEKSAPIKYATDFVPDAPRTETGRRMRELIAQFSRGDTAYDGTFNPEFVARVFAENPTEAINRLVKPDTTPPPGVKERAALTRAVVFAEVEAMLNKIETEVHADADPAFVIVLLREALADAKKG